MLKRTTSLLFVLAITALAGSCIFNPDPKPPCDDCGKTPTRQFLDRSEDWHVLNNLELSYNKRRIERYDELLDLNFTFFLTTGDVGNGLPEQWDRRTEYDTNQAMFSTEVPDKGPLCKSIKMNIQWETDDASLTPVPRDLGWIDLPNSGPNQDETWRTTTVFYDFQIDVEPDVTYINNPGSKAQFTVRLDADGTWKLVEFRDLGGSS